MIRDVLLTPQPFQVLHFLAHSTTKTGAFRPDSVKTPFPGEDFRPGLDHAAYGNSLMLLGEAAKAFIKGEAISYAPVKRDRGKKR